MADAVTSQIPRSNLAALIHASAEPSAHCRTTAEMPTAQLDELLLDERKTTPIEIVSPKEPKEIDVRASGLAQLHARLIVGLGLLGGVAIGLVWLWA